MQMDKKNSWLKYSRKQQQELQQFCEGYKEFLNRGKTERECIQEIISLAGKAGFRDLDQIISSHGTLCPGDRVFRVFMNKTVVLYIIGKKSPEEGMQILGAHIDSPRLDLKQVPLYEDSELAYLDTHYYGGLKKYLWVTIPLAIHGVVSKKDGSTVCISIGEKEDDPVFCITDLLIHLSAEQMDKKTRVAIEGENLDVLIGSRPLAQEEKDAVKANILQILKETYDMEEEDFLSAELEVVPALKARDCGLDRSMIASYGQDDRACVYTSLQAFFDQTDVPEKTLCCLLVDKEEIGSVGATGMHSRFFENTTAELLNCMDAYNELALRRCLANSSMLSCDVSAAFDPLYPTVYEKRNSAYFGHGLCFNKYTGARGKSSSNDANAEYVGQIRRIMDEAGVSFQTCELGKIDVGGGGTIAFISARYGMNVIDSGVPVLNMHAPMEISGKADLYEAYRGYKAFLAAAE